MTELTLFIVTVNRWEKGTCMPSTVYNIINSNISIFTFNHLADGLIQSKVIKAAIEQQNVINMKRKKYIYTAIENKVRDHLIILEK